ncbi:MAG: hypothetical protein OER21_05225 [Gemmatimonadota bacterium]|nr:hypothetical protein [Gemmatimonadota bacterium]
MTRFPRLLLVMLPLVPLSVATAQVTRDSARLVVRQGARVIGSEEFSFEVIPDGASQAVTFLASADYPPQPMRRVVATAGARRVTVRMVSGEGESAREYPGSGRALLADERMLSLFALAGRLEPGPVTVYAPPPGGRRQATLEDRGAELLPDGNGASARHLILRSGEDITDIWLDADGRLLRVAIPSRSLVADRLARR